jgi:Zn-dependent protease with chaperone function
MKKPPKNSIFKKPTFRFVLAMVVIPLVAFLVVAFAHNNYNNILHAALSTKYPDRIATINSLDFANICSNSDFIFDVPIALCTDAFLLQLANLVIWFSIYFNAAIVVLIVMYRLLIAGGRTVLVKLFRLYNPLAIVATYVLLVCNAIMLASIVYFGQIGLIGGVIIFPTIILIVGILGGAFLAMTVLIKTKQLEYETLSAIEINKTDQPALFKIINRVAEKLSAPLPDAVLIGLLPEFFVTQAKIKVGRKITRGSTLYISLLQAEVLSIEEFEAILAHELSHFVGKDAYYTNLFAPKYSYAIRKRTVLLQAARKNIYITGLAIPSIEFISYFIHLTTKANGKNSRQREFEADKGALKIESASFLASSLVKLGFSSEVWRQTALELLGSARKGQPAKNAAAVFLKQFKIFLKHKDAKKLPLRSSHPYDTHPDLKSRLKPLGISQTSVLQSAAKLPSKNLTSIIRNSSAYEEKPTLDFNQPLAQIIKKEKILAEFRAERAKK